MRTILLWISIAASILGGAALEGGHLSTVIQPTAALIVFGPILAFLLIRVGPTKSWLLCRRLINNDPLPKDEFTMDRLITLGFLGAGFAAVQGLIHVMSNLSDTSKLGAGIAVAFVGVFYGMLPAMLLATVRQPKIKTVSLSPKAKVLPLRKKTGGFIAASVFILLFSFMTVLFALAQVSPPVFHS